MIQEQQQILVQLLKQNQMILESLGIAQPVFKPAPKKPTRKQAVHELMHRLYHNQKNKRHGIHLHH